ncbi:GntR family transcriptional regulator [Tissierellaceae bacterium HCP3S3_D8]
MGIKQRDTNERKSLVEEAYYYIWDQICNNNIKPGEPITEISIAKELGISRTPVREAIRMLVSEDILETIDGIGTYVKVLSFKDIKDIFEVRKALEVVAVKTAINIIPESKIDELEDKLKDAMEKFNRGDLKKEEFGDIDMKVHQLIFDYCSNEYVKAIFRGMSLKIKQYQFISYENMNNSKESISQHLEILKLLRSRELERLIIFLEEHIDWALKGLLF